MMQALFFNPKIASCSFAICSIVAAVQIYYAYELIQRRERERARASLSSGVLTTNATTDMSTEAEAEVT